MTVILDSSDSDQLAFAVRRLRELKPVGVPSETVYGLAGLAQSEKALAAIFHMKNRPNFDPLIVHASSIEALDGKIIWEFALQKKLAERYWPGPLTLLFRKTDEIPDLCTAGSPWVACRIPAHPQFQALLRALEGELLAAPSANRFASISPTSSQDVCAELGPYGLEAVIEGGVCERGLESTVVKVHSEQGIEILRQGAVSYEDLAGFLGSEVLLELRSSGSGIDETQVESPGQLKRHYAPRTPLVFFEGTQLNEFVVPEKSALLRICAEDDARGLERHSWGHTVLLSESSELSEAASKLFRVLRQLDQLEGLQHIVALPTKELGLGRAINDRLKRAALY